eukprot:scaffold69992_cov50-Prasinocladus_malaysianus.AAC.1
MKSLSTILSRNQSSTSSDKSGTSSDSFTFQPNPAPGSSFGQMEPSSDADNQDVASASIAEVAEYVANSV